MKTNICDACLADGEMVRLSRLRINFATSIGRQSVDLCREHEKYVDEHGFREITQENEMEFYRFLTDLMRKAKAGHHQITNHQAEQQQ